MGDLFTSAYVDLSPAAVSAAKAKGFPTDGAETPLYTATLGSNLQPEEQRLQHARNAQRKEDDFLNDKSNNKMKKKMNTHKPAFDAFARFRHEPEDDSASEEDDDEDSPYVCAYASMLTSSDDSTVLDAKRVGTISKRQEQQLHQSRAATTSHQDQVDHAELKLQLQEAEDTEGGAYAVVAPSMMTSSGRVKTLISNYENATATNYSTLVSPRSMDEVPAVQTLTGYSTPVLTKGGAIAYADAYVSVTGGAPARKDKNGGGGDDGDGDYFPVLESTPPPSTPEERAAKAKAKAAGFDADAFAEELAVRQKVAELLASLPSGKSRQRVVEQLVDADHGSAVKGKASFEVLQPTEPIKKEKEWAKAGQGRQWNEEYQRVVSKGLKQLTAEDVRAISRLSHDFVKQAEVYAKIIINELNVPDAWKTIKPANVGGVAGGAKYIVQGTLFKFCLDPIVSKKPLVWLYGGDRPDDDNAMKAAALELQGLSLIATSQIPQLHVPLMALIDYKGFRMVATSLLPIGPDTLKYGSDDAGRTIKVGDRVMDHLMDVLGHHLNLRKHLVGKQRAAIVGPGDIEGHLGTDGRYYLLDFARLMPPETPLPDEEGVIDGRGVFFRMLRPELVRSFRVPLSSDTFTGWGMYDEDRTAYELDVREVTDVMINERVPELAAEISKLYEEGLSNCAQFTPTYLQEMLEQLNLVARMHAKGVNLRHMGRIREKMTSAKGRKLLLSLGLSRAFKTKLRRKLRASVQLQEHAGASSESACKDVTLEFFNTVLGHTEKSHHFWHVGIKKLLKSKFPFILTDEEMDEGYSLIDGGCIRLTIMLCFRLNLVRLSSAVMEAIFRDHTAVRLVETDILDIPAVIKHNHLSYIFNGNICMFEAAKGIHNACDALRLLRQAREHLRTAANMSPSCPYTNWVLGSIEVDIASRLTFDQEAERLFTSAYTMFERSCKLDKSNSGPLTSWADALEQHATRLAANDADPARVSEMRALAAAKRHLASTTKGVTTCSLITSAGH